MALSPLTAARLFRQKKAKRFTWTRGDARGMRVDPDFERKHPRAEGGRFGEKPDAPAPALDLATPAEPKADDDLLVGLPEGARFVEGKGALGKGKFAVELPGKGVVWNYEADKALVAREAKQKLSNEAFTADQKARQKAARDAIVEKLAGGAEPSDQDLSTLGLRAESDLRWFIPAAAELHGTSSYAVRPMIKDLIRTGYTDSGSKREYVDARKALMAIAKARAPEGPGPSLDVAMPVSRLDDDSGPLLVGSGPLGDRPPRPDVLVRKGMSKAGEIALMQSYTSVFLPGRVTDKGVPIVTPGEPSNERFRRSYKVLVKDKRGNYDRTVPGGIRYQWSSVGSDLTWDEAKTIYNRRRIKPPATPAPALDVAAPATPEVSPGVKATVDAYVDREILELSRKAAVKHGYDPSLVSIGKEEDSPFMLNGVQHWAAGTARIWGDGTGDIKIYTNHISKEGIDGVMAHEVMHQKYERVKAAYRLEYNRLDADMKGKDVDTWMKPDGTLRPPYDKQYPLYEAWNKNERNFAELHKQDGISEYSEKYWQGYHAGTVRTDLAYHETLAEIARLDAKMGPAATVKTKSGAVQYEGLDRIIRMRKGQPWRDYYDMVNEQYAALTPAQHTAATAKQLATKDGWYSLAAPVPATAVKPRIGGTKPGAHPAKISPSQTSTNKATVNTDNTYVQADVAAMAKDERIFEHNMGLFHNGVWYPGIRPAQLKGKTPAQVARVLINHMKTNIRYQLDNATAAQMGGVGWYRGARGIVDSRVAQYKLDEASVAGVYAALSPQKDWDINVYLGDRVIDIYQNHQNTKWDRQMEAVANRLIAAEAIKSAKAKARGKAGKLTMAPVLESIKGKKLKDLLDDPKRAGMWIRMYEEAHGDPNQPLMKGSKTEHEHGYRFYNPDGTFGDFHRNAKKPGQAVGAISKASWNSTGAIGNAVRALQANGDRVLIGKAMGSVHKVRNFYNNILDPGGLDGDVTMDTHAIGAAWMQPYSGNAAAVAHGLASSPDKAKQPANWIASKDSAPNGSFGTYGLYADAYREVAKERGMLPVEVQAVVWGVKRDLFGNLKDSEVVDIDNLWKTYHVGKATLKTTQDKVWAIGMQANARKGG